MKCNAEAAAKGSDLIPALERLPRVHTQYLPEPPKILSYLPFVIAAPIKVALQIISILLVLLVYIEKPPEFLVVQVRVEAPITRQVLKQIVL